MLLSKCSGHRFHNHELVGDDVRERGSLLPSSNWTVSTPGGGRPLKRVGGLDGSSTDEIVDKSLRSHDGSSTCENFVSAVRSWLNKLQLSDSLQGAFGETNQSELAAFISYALAMPNNFLALVDTYDNCCKSSTPVIPFVSNQHA
ncbi:hypothetical protein M5K25_006852 [Dendrobium thyrsiflorum]|uniref:nicotinate phosphoribosyltransferase n=1 Tax=Dendrobium thyrsiflorum TaxID=117978 RepID=A0ABD0VJH0_DENTH